MPGATLKSSTGQPGSVPGTGRATVQFGAAVHKTAAQAGGGPEPIRGKVGV